MNFPIWFLIFMKADIIPVPILYYTTLKAECEVFIFEIRCYFSIFKLLFPCVVYEEEYVVYMQSFSAGPKGLLPV